MFVVVLTLLFCLALGGVVLVHEAFVRRGRPVPFVPWLGRLIDRAARRVPRLPEDAQPLLRSEPRSGRMTP